MQREMLKSKIHRATVTGCDVDYVGSVTVDAELLERADIRAGEQVHIWDVDNGARVVTYALAGEPGSGTVQVNGAAARLVNIDDTVIIASFAGYGQEELDGYAPLVVHVSADNRPLAVGSDPGELLDAIGASR